jgi:hypothetical protein
MDLPDHIYNRMSLQERKHWTILKYKSDTLQSDMLKIQAEYSEMACYNSKDRRLPLIADRGLKYENRAFAAYEKLQSYFMFYHSKYY